MEVLVLHHLRDAIRLVPCLRNAETRFGEMTAFSVFFFFSLSVAHLCVYYLQLILGLCGMFIFIFTLLFHLFELFYEDSQSRVVALDLGEKEQISL